MPRLDHCSTKGLGGRWAAVEARALGRGGIARVAEATGLSRGTISAGLQVLAAGPKEDDAAGRLRGPGAGRKALAEHDAGLVAALERLVDPATRGDPTGPLRWTCSSAARLSRALQEGGHRVSEGIVPFVVELREWRTPCPSILRHVSNHAVRRAHCVEGTDQVL